MVLGKAYKENSILIMFVYLFLLIVSIVNYKGSATSTMSASGGSIVSHVN